MARGRFCGNRPADGAAQGRGQYQGGEQKARCAENNRAAMQAGSADCADRKGHGRKRPGRKGAGAGACFALHGAWFWSWRWWQASFCRGWAGRHALPASRRLARCRTGDVWPRRRYARFWDRSLETRTSWCRPRTAKPERECRSSSTRPAWAHQPFRPRPCRPSRSGWQASARPAQDLTRQGGTASRSPSCPLPATGMRYLQRWPPARCLWQAPLPMPGAGAESSPLSQRPDN